MNKPLTVAIVGCGNRGREAYGRILSYRSSDEVKVVAAADIVPERLEMTAKTHNIPKEMCFASGEELLKQPKLADLMFICTQDKQHYAHAIAALEKGYHLVLEKPISPSLSECKKIAETANKYNRTVLVCHVLRYTPFYSKVKEILNSGVLGRIINATLEEGVGYFHQAHSFVRGNWRNTEESSPMILAKCCHDMDIMVWLFDKKAKKISSFGDLNYFKAENAPEGAALRCLDCPKAVKDACPYDAEKIYIEPPRGAKAGRFWPTRVVSDDTSVEAVTKALREGPYGRCVFHCDNDVVDSQVVNIQFEDGFMANFLMTAFTKKIGRKIRIKGTLGELTGHMEENKITVKLFGETKDNITTYDTSTQITAKSHPGHGGGDEGLVKCVLDYFVNDNISDKITTIDKSIESHFIALAAEESRLHGGEVVDMDEFESKF